MAPTPTLRGATGFAAKEVRWLPGSLPALQHAWQPRTAWAHAAWLFGGVSAIMWLDGIPAPRCRAPAPARRLLVQHASLQCQRRGSAARLAAGCPAPSCATQATGLQSLSRGQHPAQQPASPQLRQVRGAALRGCTTCRPTRRRRAASRIQPSCRGWMRGSIHLLQLDGGLLGWTGSPTCA